MSQTMKPKLVSDPLHQKKLNTETSDYKDNKPENPENPEKPVKTEKPILPKSDIYPIDIYFIQCQAIDDFSNKIPQDYVYYNQVIDICNKIKDSLSYTAPEELMTYWKTKGNLRLIQYMPNPPTAWVYEAWKSINRVTKLYG